MLEPQRSTGSDASDASGGGGGSGGLVLVQAEPLSESSALPRLEQQTITTLHNLSEVKGQFFEKMWLHFAAKWSPWMSKTYKNGIGSDAESKRRKQATADTIEHMRAASDEDTDLAISATIKGKKAHLLRHLILQTIILPRQARDQHRDRTQKESDACFLKAVGHQMVFNHLEPCFVADLYARRYWQTRREAISERSKAAAALRAAKREARAEAEEAADPSNEKGRDPDASPLVEGTCCCSCALHAAPSSSSLS